MFNDFNTRLVLVRARLAERIEWHSLTIADSLLLGGLVLGLALVAGVLSLGASRF
jgi:hypothetical protein